MKILVTSDVHADLFKDYDEPLPGKPYGTRFERLLNAIRLIYDKAFQMSADMVVINGDLYNTRTSINPIVTHYIQKVIKEYQNVHGTFIPTVINVGNHDQYDNSRVPFNSVSTFEELFSTIIVTKVPTLMTDPNGGDTICIFIPYSEDVDWLKGEFDKCMVEYHELYEGQPLLVFGHLGVDGAVQGRWNHRLGGAFSLGDLHAEEADMVILGHYHKRQNLTPNVFYTGNPVGINHNDDNQQKGYYVVSTEDPKNVTATFVPIPQPMFRTIDLADTELSPEEIQMALKSDFVRVVAHTPEQVAKVEEAQEESNNGNLGNVNVSYQKEQTFSNRLDINMNANEKEIVEAYTKEFYPEVTQLSLDTLNQAEGVK